MSERLRNKDILLRYDPEELAQAHMNLNRGLFAHGVLGNIISNAIMLSPYGSTIVITHRVVEEMHEIDVLDRGPGVPEFTMKQLKEKEIHDAGSSFGLLIAQQVVELHGGELQVQNSVNGASIVRVRLPI
jgi:K+-sensing histidine kinase KdpD